MQTALISHLALSKLTRDIVAAKVEAAPALLHQILFQFLYAAALSKLDTVRAQSLRNNIALTQCTIHSMAQS